MAKVAIIGAGASGIITAKVLSDKGFDVTIFEKSNNIAGVWNFGKEGVLYKSLKTNLPKEIMVFEEENIPYDANKSFIDYEQVKKYLVDNAYAWGVNKLTKFNCDATSLNPKISSEAQSKYPKWWLTYKNNQKIHKELFDFVAVCNGHYNTPNIPNNMEGIDKAKDLISHSKYYRSPDNHAKDILCVGYSSSGVDISNELLQSDRNVFVAIRNIDKNREQKNLATVSKEIKFISPPVKFIKKNSKCQVITENGSEIEVGEVILCTGYNYSFPFLSNDIISTNNNVVNPLFNQLLHERYLNLAFIGLPWKVLPFILSESQAIFLSKIWRLDNSIIDISKDLESSIFRLNKLKSMGLPIKYFHMLGDDQWDYDSFLLEVVNELTDFRKQRIQIIKEIYNDSHKLKEADYFTFRKANYLVNFNKLEWFREL